MSGHSVPIDFWVDPSLILEPAKREKLLADFFPFIQPFSGPLKKVLDCDVPGGHYMAIYASDHMTVTVKLYNTGLVSSSVEYFVSEDTIDIHRIDNDNEVCATIMNSKDGRKIEMQIKEKFKSKRAKVLPALKRAPPINPYFTTSDDRLLEYDVKALHFEEVSPFQKVQIYETQSFGNMLVLDDLQNLSESDINYTRALMDISNEDYKDKEILILGGGDGALLWELLKEKPKFVTLIDIDEAVIRACRQHLRSTCGDCLDKFDSTNYKIIIGDAIAYMKDYIKEGRLFDYVFGDLTDIPISEAPRGELWDFLLSILSLGIQLVKPKTGKYLTHAIGIQCTTAIEMFEEQLKKLPVPISYTSSRAHVPCFMEKWTFYQLSRK